MRFLVADDDPVYRTVLGRMIERLGYAVDVVQNGSEAVASAAVVDYDVVVLDVHMPVLDGMAAARSLRAAQPTSRHPYLIAVSERSDPELRDQCMAAGLDTFLLKPARIETLKDVISAIPARSEDATGRPRAWSIHRRPDRRRDDESEPVIDFDVVRRFRTMMGADDEEFVRELEADFVQDAATLSHAIERAGRAGDHDSMARAAHALKSNSAMFGATRLSSVARSIERLADAGLPQPWEPLYRRLMTEIDDVRTSLMSPDFA